MKDYTILIVDDDFQNLQTLYRKLQAINSNYKVFKTNKAEKAFKLAINKKPDLIITDWEMPVMNGIQLIEALNKNTITKDIPVIMITGIMLTSEDLKTAFDAGAIDYITKPVTTNELYARVNSVLKLADSYSEIKKLTNAKDNLIKMIGHDMQGSFSGIISLGKLLSENFDNFSKEKIKEFLLLMSEGAQKSYDLFDKLLYWALTQTDEIIFDPKKVFLKKIFLETEKYFQNKTKEKGIKLKFTSNINDAIYADENMLTSILQNLINNAIKFSHSGSSIYVKIIQENNSTKICVIDEGVGIIERNQQLLFNIDTIQSTYGTKNEKGTGIGLILCKEFVEKHNGVISVKSKKGKGSQFCFTLPNKQ